MTKTLRPDQINDFVNDVTAYFGSIHKQCPKARVRIMIGPKAIELPTDDKTIARVLEGIELACKEV